MNWAERNFNMKEFILNPNIDKVAREIEFQKRLKYVKKKRELQDEFLKFALMEMRGVSLEDFLGNVEKYDKMLINKFLNKDK